jgi:glycosyltransferase involved in cell wall biosynthesis
MNILHVSTADIGGGAEKIASNLFEAQRRLGHRCWLAVGRKRRDDARVLLIPNDRSRGRWTRSWLAVGDLLERRPRRSRLAAIGATVAIRTADPIRSLNRYRGVEDFDFPGTWRLLDICPEPPDIVHLHNLHGGYFDLRALPWLSQQVLVVLTLHDAWMLSGHCAQSYGCVRWKSGCGDCPDLNTYPRVARDATAYNWRRKAAIYRRSQLHVGTPSRWLMNRVDQSMLAEAIVDRRVVHNGIDCSTFRPGNRQQSRKALGLPADARILLCAANRIRENDSKDLQLMRAAVERLSLACRPVVFVAIGDEAASEQVGRSELRFVPFQSDPAVMAQYYQAADIYLHAARAESWGLAITEALASGTPVVATAVGGIPEQVKSLVECLSDTSVPLPAHGPERATGILVSPGDRDALTRALDTLLADDALRAQIGRNAADDAAERFELRGQAQAYLAWYAALLARSAPAMRVASA